MFGTAQRNWVKSFSHEIIKMMYSGDRKHAEHKVQCKAKELTNLLPRNIIGLENSRAEIVASKDIGTKGKKQKNISE
jgi:hypothetical protein